MKVKQHNHFLDAEALAYLAVRIVSSGREFVVDGESVAVSRPKRRMISRGVGEKIVF